MPKSPIPAILYVIGFAMFTDLIIQGSAVAEAQLPQCTGWTEILGGCDGFLSDLLHLAVLGTIPGAPPALNVFFGFIGLAVRAQAIWAIADWVRGR